MSQTAHQDEPHKNDGLRDQLIDAAITHVPFDGWTRSALVRAAADIGMPAKTAEALFPGQGVDMIAWHSRLADRRMAQALEERDLNSLKIRERIAAAVMTRLEQNIEHREAVRRGLSILTLPQNAAIALKLLYETVDEMWFQAGDRSTDWNFYSKRSLLAGVYSSTLMVWLNDHDPDLAETRAFLDRRIENVMQVPKLKARLGSIFDAGFKAGPGRLRAFRTFRSGMRGAN